MKMQSKMMRNQTGRAGSRRGFTLVELLVVIAIIGVLAAIALPAILTVRTSFAKTAVKFEVMQIADAVEKYRAQYGDYPPDGSSWPIMERHLRKAFPDILISELNLLNPAYRNTATQNGSVADVTGDYAGRVMDPAEALVFFLGGFSSDKQRPFTGKGGPFKPCAITGQGLEYNTQREKPFYEFASARLTLDASSAVVSSDEVVFAEPSANPPNPTEPDLLPVYMSYNTDVSFGSPYVYFDSRTYQVGTFYNFHQVTSNASRGAARPYLKTPIGSASPVYENLKTYQILSPGLDGFYGGLLGPTTTPTLFTSKGMPFAPNASGVLVDGTYTTKFGLPSHGTSQPAHDNSANFIETPTLGENISN